MEGPSQGQEQEVDGTRKRKTTATTGESWGYDWLHLEKEKEGMLLRCGAASAGSTIKTTLHNTHLYIIQIHT